MPATQDRVVYGTDNVLYPPDKSDAVLKEWAATYERDWRCFSGELPAGPGPPQAVSRQRREVVSRYRLTGDYPDRARAA